MSQKQIRYINTQSGRSMVEMLGTLAIMGVLTIGGIAGYRYAINKSNANTILNAVSQMAVTASVELTTQGSLTLPEWKDANGNLSISGAFGVETARYDDGAFGIIVSDMNDEVCERIKGMDWKVPEDIAINDESDVCDQGEANKIAFVFSNTLTKKSAPGNAGGESGEDTPDEPDNTTCPAGTSTTGAGENTGFTDRDGNICKCINAGESYTDSDGCQIVDQCAGRGIWIGNDCCDTADDSENCCKGLEGDDAKWSTNGCCPHWDFIPDNSPDRTGQSCCNAFGYHWGSSIVLPWSYFINTCCEPNGGSYINGQCCFGDYIEQQTTKECCIGKGGRWNGSRCLDDCDDPRECCEVASGMPVIDENDTFIECCFSETQSETCCKDRIENWGRSDLVWNGTSCESCSSEHQSKACCDKLRGAPWTWNGTSCEECWDVGQSEACRKAIEEDWIIRE